MKILIRVLVAAITPPVLGLLLVLGWLQAVELTQGMSPAMGELADELPFLLKAAFAFALVPSIFVFAVFEFILSKRIKSLTSYILFGALFGYLSGVFILYVINQQIWLFHSLDLIGAVVGMVMGSIFHFLYRPGPCVKFRSRQPEG